jgi:NTP pyrophosphatase (non-canonical NTP hydrolase)
MIKKMLFHGRAIDLENFSKEMGDVLWYWTNLALAMNLSPSEIAQENIRKLKERYPERWSNDR